MSDDPAAPSPGGATTPLGRLAATPGGPWLVLRAFLGVTFTFAGLQKLANPHFFQASYPGSIQQQLIAAGRTSPVHFLVSVAQHAPVLFGVAIAIGEIAVGLGTLFGFLSRAAACGGMALSLTFFLTVSFNTSPYYYGPDIVFLFAWTPLAISGAGALSVDALLAGRVARQREALALRRAGAKESARQLAEIDRRSVIAHGVVGASLAAATLFLGGVDADIGRSFAPNDAAGGSAPQLPGAGATGPGSGSVASGASTTTVAGAPATPKGTRIGPASDVPVGGAASFTDPAEQLPAYAVQPTVGHFLAFSAVCTHEGCTVQFVRKTETFNCPCHGSIFDAKTGAVLGGPAPSPLPQIVIAEGPNGQLYVDG